MIINQIDDYFLNLFHLAGFNPILDYFFLIITFFGTFYFGCIFQFIYYFLTKSIEKTKIVFLAFLANTVIVYLLKNIIKRPRPEIINPSYIPTFNDYSFPSGHATLSFYMAVILIYEYPKYWYIFFTTALLITFSRLYFGYHYLSDVIFASLRLRIKRSY